MRIATLLPSATEIVHALGLGASLVARSHECDYPDGVRALPAVTRSKIDTSATSADIDRQVKASTAGRTAIYSIDRDALERLRPDVIVTQDQCDVCAVDLDEVRACVRGIPSLAGAKIVALAPTSLADVYADIREVARAAGAPAAGNDLVAGLEARVAAVARRSHGARSTPRVACIEWADPLMIAANWTPELVALAGGASVLARAGEPSRYADWHELVASAPEVLVIMPCGFDLARAVAERDNLRWRRGWSEMPAVRNEHIVAVDGNAYFNRPGPRLVDSLEILAHAIAPALHPDVHPGAWRALPR